MSEPVVGLVVPAKGKGEPGQRAVQIVPANKSLLRVKNAMKAMLDLEARRMYERDTDDDARVQPCPCPGCDGLRQALAAIELVD